MSFLEEDTDEDDDLFVDEDTDEDDDLSTAVGEHWREFRAASFINNDLDFAFNLQLEEAIKASLYLQQHYTSPSSSTSSSSAPGPSCTVGDTSGQPSTSPSSSTSSSSAPGPSCTVGATSKSCSVGQYAGQFRLELVSLAHIAKVPERVDHENQTQDSGKNGEGLPENLKGQTFRVYSKWLIEKPPLLQNFKTQNEDDVFGAIGVAICDSNGISVFDTSKPLHDKSICRPGLELQALIEGLNVALSFGIQMVILYCDHSLTFQYATGQWRPKNQRVDSLLSQLNQLRTKFKYCIPTFVSSNETQLALSLAREAIELQKNTHVKIVYEKCVVCLEDIDISKIFSVDVCKHRYCFSCIKKHVEVKLLGGMLPKCPHERCKTELKVDSCKLLLRPNLNELFNKLLKEASIPVTDRLYCPYPKCSALMSKARDLSSKGKITLETAAGTGRRKCVKCNGLFCILCRVPWHDNMMCSEYQTRYPYPCGSERLLKCLAETQSWSQCVKCYHMIELAEGCYHMTCRCGYEFCYTCGAEYKEKKATCNCPSWDEDYIYSGSDDDSDEEWDEEEDDETEENVEDDEIEEHEMGFRE